MDPRTWCLGAWIRPSHALNGYHRRNLAVVWALDGKWDFRFVSFEGA